MKKRTKITLRTKIYLAIAGLLAVTGALYATGHPQFLTNVSFATGVTATPDLLLVTPYCSDEIDKVNCDGTVSMFASIPGFGTCREKYMAAAPSTSGPPNNTFTPRDVFVTVGGFVYRVDINTHNATPFAFMEGCVASDHNGITFDHVGTFGYDMLVTCREGNVFRINSTGGAFMPIATVNAGEIEGPAVVPQSFGPLGGQLLVADEGFSALHAIRNNNPPGPGPYSVTLNVFTHPTAEGVFVVPQTPCTFCTGPNAGAFFQAIQDGQQIWKTPLADFAGLGGDVLVTSETTGNTVSIHWNGTQYVESLFQNIQGANEGSSFVDCAVPTATPTSTPTPTVTPTTCGTGFVIGDLDAVVGHKVTFWGAQWWKKNHLSGGTAPASFKGFVNCTTPNPPACGGTWISDPGNSSHPPDTVPADMTVIVSSLITKNGPIESGDIPKMVTIHTDPGYGPAPGHEGTGTVTAVICP
jgi:hypothetical protein